LYTTLKNTPKVAGVTLQHAAILSFQETFANPHFSPRSLLLSSVGAALSKRSDRAAGCGI
jgi:hypothetical protein